jgi:hypothetical protein
LNENLEKEAVERTQMTESRARQLQNLAVELIEAEENEWQLFARQGCPNTQCKEVLLVIQAYFSSKTFDFQQHTTFNRSKLL